jgi:large conductance mechanosensitive channel
MGEFKKFITRGNVLDMAVGVIVGGAFTGIVNGLSNYILKPIINWLLALILGGEGLSGVISPLSMATNADGTYDLANSIYIDWGAFISAIINFFLIAFVLFTIVRIMNRIREQNDNLFPSCISRKCLPDQAGANRNGFQEAPYYKPGKHTKHNRQNKHPKLIGNPRPCFCPVFFYSFIPHKITFTILRFIHNILS